MSGPFLMERHLVENPIQMNNFLQSEQFLKERYSVDRPRPVKNFQ
jgi:hypothetical protein